MDYELMGGDARQAIIDEDGKRNICKPAAAGAVRLAPMADADHAGTGPRGWRTFRETETSSSRS